MNYKTALLLLALCSASSLQAKQKPFYSSVTNESDSAISIYDRATKQTHLIEPKSTKEVALSLGKQLELTHNGNTKVVYSSRKRVKVKDAEIKKSTRAGRFAQGAVGGALSAPVGRKASSSITSVALFGAIGGLMSKALGYSKENINVRTINGVSDLSAFNTPRTLKIDAAGAITSA